MSFDPHRLRDSIQAQLDQRISDEEFDWLARILTESAGARRTYVELAKLDSGLRDLQAVDLEKELLVFPVSEPVQSRDPQKWALALAAIILALALPGLLMYRPGGDSEMTGGLSLSRTTGVAVITAESGAVWEGNASKMGPGVALPPGRFVLAEGLAQIDFFGGASISLSAPAEIELIDRDAAVLYRGRLKADVPPAARGFEIRAGDVILEDLGTSFGLSVGEDEQADLVVFDGEVRAKGRNGQRLLVTGGQSAQIREGVAVRQEGREMAAYPDIADIITGSGNREESRYAAWREESLERMRDPRLIAYYDFENLTEATRRLRNRAVQGGGTEFDGGIVGARMAEGRWKDKTALDFRAEGDRVRFDIPGEFTALTLFAWVRIDALDRNLNSLFLTDYFDENEIHWQISNQGNLHFASSPAGVEDIPRNNRRFYSEGFWDPTRSGQWFLLATTASAGVGNVTHYVNGRAIGFSGGTNMEKPLTVFRIGEADLGNWSEPIWEKVIRTLNGRIDEFAIYRECLSPEEISAIYETGKP